MKIKINRWVRFGSLVALVGTIALPLHGCVAMVAGGAAMGTLSATDRRTLGAQTEDKSIVVRSHTVIRDEIGSTGNVNVTSFNRKVLVTGEVPNEAVKEKVSRSLRSLQGVEGVTDELAVTWSSSFTSRSNDALITSKVVANLLADNEVNLNQFKVTTERGNVYLMGIVTQKEALAATQIARKISGVKSVVKVFDYID